MSIEHTGDGRSVIATQLCISQLSSPVKQCILAKLIDFAVIHISKPGSMCTQQPALGNMH